MLYTVGDLIAALRSFDNDTMIYVGHREADTILAIEDVELIDVNSDDRALTIMPVEIAD